MEIAIYRNTGSHHQIMRVAKLYGMLNDAETGQSQNHNIKKEDCNPQTINPLQKGRASRARCKVAF